MTTTTVSQAIADIDNRSDDPFCDEGRGPLSPWAVNRLREIRAASERRIAAMFHAGGISHLNDSCICAVCGGCTDRQDAEARQFGVACVCEEGKE